MPASQGQAPGGRRPREARARVRSAWPRHAEHGWRCLTVWAKRGEAKLAEALEHLAVIAGAAALPAHTSDAMAEAYAANGWKIDAAALAALDIARTGEYRDAVITALRAVYLPWLDAGAAALQTLATQGKLPFAQPAIPPKPPENAALIFVDGLRVDIAIKGRARLGRCRTGKCAGVGRACRHGRLRGRSPARGIK